MIHSLHGRLILFVGASVLVLFAISGVAICWLIEASLWAEFDSGLRDRAESLSQLIEQDHHGLIFEWQEGGGVPTPIDAKSEVLSVWKDGQIVNQFPEHATALDIALEPSHRIVDVQLADATPGRSALLTFQPRVEPEDIEDDLYDGIPSAKVTLAFARPTTAIDTTIHRLRSLLATIGVAGLFATMGIVWLAINVGLRPIDVATDQISSIQSETLDQRIDDGSHQPRELRPLIQTINRLLSRLQVTLDRERAFSADVAHELRTPLAGLRAKIDVALSKPRTAIDHEATLSQCLAITKQTSMIVESLLATTTIHPRETSLEPINLRPVIIEMVDGNEQCITTRELMVKCEIPDDATIAGPNQSVKMLFRNLIDNAITYSDAGSTINIVAVAMPNSLRVRISNPTKSFLASDIEKVFERFWRADISRTATGKHSGLGLQLCKRLTESLGGTIEASYVEQEFAITLQFPV